MHRIKLALVALGLLLAVPTGARAEAPSAPPGWWHIFADPRLDALIERAHAGNPSIAQYAARLAAARAAARLQKSDSAPQLGLSASASRAGGPLINDVGGTGSLFAMQATVTWAPDVLGKAARSATAQRHDVEAAKALLDGTRLLVETETALALFECRAATAWRHIAERRLAIDAERIRIAQGRLDRGLSSRIAADDERIAFDEAREELASAMRSQATAQSRLGALIGDAAAIETEEAPLADPPEIPPNLPDRLLARRPDLVAARARVEAADARLSATRRAWLPDIVLTASGGGASTSLGQLLAAASRGYGFGLLLASPLLDGGQHKAQVAGARAAVAVAEAEYRERLVSAFQEIADSLAAITEGRELIAARVERTALTNTRHKALAASYVAGLGSRISLLDAEIAQLDAQRGEVDARTMALAGTVRLIRSIGGGPA